MFLSTEDAYYPPPAFYFNVQLVSALSVTSTMISGANIDNSFQEVEGITATVQTEDIVEGGENRYKHRVPTSVDYSNLVLKRGYVTKFSEFAEWCMARQESTLTFGIKPKNIMLSLLDSEGSILTAWFFVGAWPVKMETSGFNSMDNKYLIENMEFTYQYYSQVKMDPLSIAAKAARALKEKLA
ncbi:MAG: phage tail protein [Balneolaceae bacterium]|nr:phage tail protein [Balneolaceae bacterium]